MIGVLLTWLFSFLAVIALIVLVLYQLMCLADLEYDYINPYDSAARINNVILPEFITHAALACLYLLTGNWFMCLLCIPCLYYNAKMYMDRKHLIDVTEIFNHLNWEKKKRLFKVGYLVVLLFFSLFWYVTSTLKNLIADTHHFSESVVVIFVGLYGLRCKTTSTCDWVCLA